jgi:hypothetical protein
LRAEDSSVTLHDFLHVTTNDRCVLGSSRLSDLIKNSERFHSSVFGDLLMWLTGLGGLGDVVCACTTEDDDIEE